MPLLQIDRVSHAFDYPLFENVNLALEEKESMAILGVSGCGKSTLLHICSTLLKPLSGEVSLLGQNIYTQTDDIRLTLRRYDIGIIFQSHYLFKGFFANENIELASLLSNQTMDERLLEKLGIAEFMHYKVGDLSGGQQQRVSIARVLAKKPKIIFADEPTGNLDKDTANVVMNTLFNYIKENDAGLILVTHEEDLAFRCDKVFKLEELNLKEIK